MKCRVAKKVRKAMVIATQCGLPRHRLSTARAALSRCDWRRYAYPWHMGGLCVVYMQRAKRWKREGTK